MKNQGKAKTFLSLDYNPQSFKTSPNIIYVHLSFYGFEKLNNLEKTYSRTNFRFKDYYLKRS